MAKLRWTREAEQWLKNIHDYIAADKREAAQKVIAGKADFTKGSSWCCCSRSSISMSSPLP
ncbi:MAG: hypothetical protein ACYCYR_17615 [Desulfobulbaceae bacterium]